MTDDLEENHAKEAIGETALLPDEELLTLKQLAEQSGWDYEKLRSYLRDAPQVNEHVQARRKKGSKGLGYPPDSIPFFEKMLADVNAGKLVPTTLAGWLADLSMQPEAIGPKALSPANVAQTLERRIVGQSALSPDVFVARLVEALERHAEALRSVPAPAPMEDELLTLKTAHERYGLSLKTLRGLKVREGKTVKVKRSDCLRYIEKLSAESTY